MCSGDRKKGDMRGRPLRKGKCSRKEGLNSNNTYLIKIHSSVNHDDVCSWGRVCGHGDHRGRGLVFGRWTQAPVVVGCRERPSERRRQGRWRNRRLGRWERVRSGGGTGRGEVLEGGLERPVRGRSSSSGRGRGRGGRRSGCGGGGCRGCGPHYHVIRI